MKIIAKELSCLDNKQKNLIIGVISSCIIIISLYVLTMLHTNSMNHLADSSTSEANNQKVEENIESNTSENASNQEKTHYGLNETEYNQLKEDLADFSVKDEEDVNRLLSAMPSDQTRLLENQDDITNLLNDLEIEPTEVSQLILPKEPATVTDNGQNQLNVPLILQRDPEWNSIKYGSDSEYELLGEAGCAIVSLAMLESYFTNKEVSPKEILDWSKDAYYVHNEGTSWQIFGYFAEEFGYKFMNYGNNFYPAMEALKNGEVIIASVEPGFFTNIGHILVIRGYDNGKVYVNDPNDDVSKMYSLQALDESIFLEEGLNYWAFYKE